MKFTKSLQISFIMTAFSGVIQNYTYAQIHYEEFDDKIIPCTGALCAKQNGVFMHYCDGDQVVIQACVERRPVKWRTDCVGPKRIISKFDFLDAVISQISVENAPQLKPLTEDDVKFFRKSSDQAKEGELELCTATLNSEVNSLQKTID